MDYCGGSAGVGKPSLYSYHGKDWIWLGPSIEGKSRENL